MRRSYIKASRVPSPHLVRTCNSGKVSEDMTNTEDTDLAFFFWQAIDVSRQQRKKSVWTENAAITLISNFLSTEVKRSPQMIYTSLQSQLRKSQNAGAYLGNTNIQKENLIYSSCISRWVLSIPRAVTTLLFVTRVGLSVSRMHHPCTNISESANDVSETGATGVGRPA